MKIWEKTRQMAYPDKQVPVTETLYSNMLLLTSMLHPLRLLPVMLPFSDIKTWILLAWAVFAVGVLSPLMKLSFEPICILESRASVIILVLHSLKFGILLTSILYVIILTRLLQT